MLILLSNDDGIRAPGLRFLHDALTSLGRVAVVAPDRDQSAVSHSLTLHNPLRFNELSPSWYEVNGTPTDCINLAVNNILAGERPALIVAGINDGLNLGDDVTYSGTVSAAMEGTILGIPSIAFSLAEDPTEENIALRTNEVAARQRGYAVAAAFARKLVQQVLQHGVPQGTFLNVNIPCVERSEELRGVQITRQGKRQHHVPVLRNVDPRGRPYFWIGGSTFQWLDEEGTDVAAVRAGCVSITPLQLDLTNYAAYDVLRRWHLTP